jgi:DNA-binding winged helix-turn-helix (wHTH) protein/tetratricopeptide (TPR) repeat protein
VRPESLAHDFAWVEPRVHDIFPGRVPNITRATEATRHRLREFGAVGIVSIGDPAAPSALSVSDPLSAQYHGARYPSSKLVRMTSPSPDLQTGFRIGVCVVEPRQNRITRAGTEIRVERRVMDVLVCLAAHAGEVVSRETLNTQVWGSVVVTDQAVTNCISELRQCLGDDQPGQRIIETIPKRGYRLTAPVRPIRDETAATAAPDWRRWRVPAGLTLAAAVVLGLAGWWWSRATGPRLTSVAVLRFENAASDEGLDYLGLALPDEIATLLTESRDLAVRPIDYVDAAQPVASARSRGVDHIVTGRYYLEDAQRISLAIEAQHVPQERVIWRTRMTAATGDLLLLRAQVAQAVREGLLPALGAGHLAVSGAPPANEEAYQLYMRSLALPQQPVATERAIEMLERAVTLEPNYSSAWQALGTRLYDHGTYGIGGEPARQRSLMANRKALELDPRSLTAARQIVMRRAEAGDHEGAYHDARRLLEEFGSTVETHFALSYVYRYGGLLDEAQRHCELARDHDRSDPRLRSCAYAYLHAGKLDRVMEFLGLDEGSYFVHWGTVLYHLRRNDAGAALQVTRQTADEPTRRFMEPCLEGARGAMLDTPAVEFLKQWELNGDPEAAYATAPMLAYCGRPDDALRFLERAVESGYCSYPALDLDPAWISLREHRDFPRLRAAAMSCHERFRRVVNQS